MNPEPGTAPIIDPEFGSPAPAGRPAGRESILASLLALVVGIPLGLLCATLPLSVLAWLIATAAADGVLRLQLFVRVWVCVAGGVGGLFVLGVIAAAVQMLRRRGRNRA